MLRVLQSRQFSSSSSPDTPRTKVALESRQCLHFAHSTHDLRRGLRAHRTNRTLACISRTQHARSPQRVARTPVKSHSHLHFAHSTRTISTEGCVRTDPIALSPAFGTLDTHDLRRGLRAHRPNRTLACISRTRRARSPQRVSRTWGKSHSRLHFAHSTRTISAEGCAHIPHIALSPAFRALDTHDLRRGSHFRLTLFAPPSAFKREFIKWGNVFSLGHLPWKFSILSCSVSVEASVFKCKCRNVSVQGIFRKNRSQCFREKEGVGGGRREASGVLVKIYIISPPTKRIRISLRTRLGTRHAGSVLREGRAFTCTRSSTRHARSCKRVRPRTPEPTKIAFRDTFGHATHRILREGSRPTKRVCISLHAWALDMDLARGRAADQKSSHFALRLGA